MPMSMAADDQARILSELNPPPQVPDPDRVISSGGSEDPGIQGMCGQIVDLCTMAKERSDELASQSVENFDETAWAGH
jgi:hypothetical protein